MSTSLEPPSRPYTSATGGFPDSTRTSLTQFDMEDDEHQRPPLPPPLPSPIATIPSLHEQQNEAQLPPSDSTAPLHPSELSPSDPTPPSLPASPQLSVPQTPQTHLTFLLVSGRRRTMSFEPETTVGRVKELVWNAWPEDWQDDRPPAPSYLRILHLGKMLQDDDTLTKLKFPAHTTPPPPTPSIVHLSIRPYAPPGQSGDIKKKKRGLSAVVGVGGGGGGGDVLQGDAAAAAAGAERQEGGAGGAGCCGCVVC